MMMRAKVFRLNKYGKWDDMGTGDPSFDYSGVSKNMRLSAVDEDTNLIIVSQLLTCDVCFRIEEDSMILWTDPKSLEDWCLSFQMSESCSYIWDQLQSVRGACDSIARDRVCLPTPNQTREAITGQRRVKLYLSYKQSRWYNRGTGPLSLDYLNKGYQDLRVFVSDEKTNFTLFSHRIRPDYKYSKDADKLISLRKPGFPAVWYISFQEATGCSETWDLMNVELLNFQLNSLLSEKITRVPEEDGKKNDGSI